MKKQDKKLAALGQLSDTINKKTPQQMKDYMQSFKGTDLLNRPGQELEDEDLVSNIKKSYKKK